MTGFLILEQHTILLCISLFRELRKPTSYCCVLLPNDQTTEIIGLGDIKLHSGMKLKNVLCVPSSNIICCPYPDWLKTVTYVLSSMIVFA